jgi:energy-converting hydrogenase Eha subunit A
MSELVRRRWLLLMIAQAALLNLVALGPMQVLAPIAARDGYLGTRGYALFLTAAGLGSVTGGLLMLRWSPHRPLVVCAAATVAFPLPCLALAAGAALWQVTAVYTLLGAAEAVFATLWSTALQHNVPPEVLGRVSSWDFLGSFASLPLGMALTGPLVTGTGPTTRPVRRPEPS